MLVTVPVDDMFRARPDLREPTLAVATYVGSLDVPVVGLGPDVHSWEYPLRVAVRNQKPGVVFSNVDTTGPSSALEVRPRPAVLIRADDGPVPQGYDVRSFGGGLRVEVDPARVR